MGYKLKIPRIEAAAEPYPGCWTHHILISNEPEIDDELSAWVRETAAFSEIK